jgi:pimeloyl-ACP methyl ester carboxylesterase
MNRTLAALLCTSIPLVVVAQGRTAELAWETTAIKVGAESIAAERAWLDVPERHDRPDGARLRLPILRLRATSPTPGAPILWLAGGPGESGIARVTNTYRLFALLRAHGDVIAFDQRGTGAAEPSLVIDGRLDLLSSESVDSPATRTRVAAVASLLRSATERRGIDLSAYNTRESAHDVDALRRALGVPRVVLVAHSYGTHLALAVAKYHGAGVQRVVLGGVNGLGDRWREPLAMDGWLTRVAKAMSSDTDAARFALDFTAQVSRVLTQLERQPLTVETATGPVLIGRNEIQLLVTLRSGDLDFVQGLPGLFDSLEKRTRPEDVARMVQQTLRQRPIGTAMTYAMHVASGVSKARRAAIADQAPRSMFGNAINWGIADDEFVRALGVADLGEAFRSPFQSDIPALLISGTLDGRTSEADARAAGMQFRRAAYVTIDGAAHDFFFRQQPGSRNCLTRFCAASQRRTVPSARRCSFDVRDEGLRPRVQMRNVVSGFKTGPTAIPAAAYRAERPDWSSLMPDRAGRACPSVPGSIVRWHIEA